MSAIHKLYDIDYSTGKVKRKNKKCPRCNVFMARHNDPPRWACGKCGYTEFIPVKK
jgi:small subunit ribosomal protein S27Ae